MKEKDLYHSKIFMVEPAVVAVEFRLLVVVNLRACATPWHASSLGSWEEVSLHSESETASSCTTRNPRLPSPVLL